MGIAAALTAGASLFQGVYGFSQGQYQSQVASNNAKIAGWNANTAVMRSQIEQQDQDRQSAGAVGQLVADQGASGVSLGSGSAAATRSSLAKLGREDALRTRYAGDVEAYNYRTQQANFQAEAGAQEAGGIGSLVGGFLGAGASLIGGAKPVSDKWNWMRQQPTFQAGSLY